MKIDELLTLDDVGHIKTKKLMIAKLLEYYQTASDGYSNNSLIISYRATKAKYQKDPETMATKVEDDLHGLLDAIEYRLDIAVVPVIKQNNLYDLSISISGGEDEYFVFSDLLLVNTVNGLQKEIDDMAEWVL